MSSTEGKKEDGVVNTTESKEEGKKEGKKEETLEEKREQMSARAQRAAEGRERAARSKRERRWRAEGVVRFKELDIMRHEDSLSLKVEIRRRRTTLLNLVAARLKQQASNNKIRTIAEDESKKVIGKAVDKGWYQGSHVYASSPNVISQFGSGEDGHTDSITCMSVDPSERFLYTASRDNLIKVWNIDTATPIATYNGHKGAVTVCKLLTVALPQCPQTYGKTDSMADDAAELRKLGPHTSEISTTRVGHTLFTAAQDFSVRKWDPKLRGWITFNQALEIVKEAHHQIIHGLAISPNGEHLATCSADGTIVLWNMRRMLKIFTFVGHRDAVTSLCFSKDSDGQFLVSSSGATDATIKLWDTYVWERLSSPPEPKEFVPVHRGVYKGMINFSGGIKTVHHTEQTPLNLPIDTNDDISDSSETDEDEDEFIPLPTGPIPGTQRVVGEGKRGQPPIIPETPEEEEIRLKAARILAAEKVAAIAKQRNQWNLFRRKKKASNKNDDDEANRRSAVVPKFEDKDPIAARGGLIRTFAVRRSGEANHGHTGWINHVCFSNSGRRVASASCDHTIRLWNPKNGKRRAVLVGHKDWVMHCGFSTDDKTLISASADHSVRLWDVASRTPLHVLRGHRDTVNYCIMLRSGRILSCGADKKIFYWQVAPLAPLPPPLVEVTHVNTDYFDVRWVVPSGMGRPLTSYCIQLRGGYRAAMGLNAADVDMTPLEFAQGHEWGRDQMVSIRDHMKIEGEELIPGGLYQIRVAAISKVGQGGWSDPCRLVRLHATEPGRIDRPGIEAITSTALSISWKQPRMMGARILHYRIQIQGGNYTFKSGKDVIVTSNDARKGAVHVLKLLKKQNKLEIEAMQEKDDMTDTQKRRLAVRRAMLKREMKKKRMALRETQKNAHVGEGGLVAHTVKKLRPGFQYNFRVCAVNRIGSGTWSRATYSTSTASIPPETCIPPRIHGNQQCEVQVSWKPPYDNGAKIVQYYLKYGIMPPEKEKPKEKIKNTSSKKLKDDNDSDDSDENEIDEKTEEEKKEEKEQEKDPLEDVTWTVKKLSSRQPWTAKVDFLEPATKYLFYLSAENDKGVSMYSQATISATTATPPEAPSNTLAVATASNKMTVFWPKPYDNGAAVRSYIIKRRAGGEKGTFGNKIVVIAALCKLKPPQVDSFGRPYGYELLPDTLWLGTEIDGLRANTVYEFSISGVNKYGVGKSSYPTAEVPTFPPVVALQMIPPVLFDQTPDSCVIKWTPPTWDGGAEITSYRLRRDLNNDSNWGNERAVKPGDGDTEVDLPCKIVLTASRDRLQKTKKYRYQVAAVSVAGMSPWSEASNEMKIPTKMEFIVINNDRKKAAKKKAAEAKKKAAEAKKV